MKADDRQCGEATEFRRENATDAIATQVKESNTGRLSDFSRQRATQTVGKVGQKKVGQTRQKTDRSGDGGTNQSGTTTKA